MSKQRAVGLGLRAALVGAAVIAAACSGGGDPERADSAQEALTLAVPFRVRAIDFTAFADSDTSHEGNCGSGPVDQQTVSDKGITCGVGYTKPGEWLEYSLQIATGGKFDFLSRVAGNATGKTFRLLIDGVAVGGSQSVPSTGWTAFADRQLSDVTLTAGAHTLRVLFETGDTNLNYIDVTPGTVALPQRIEAENYQRALESTPTSNSGTGCNRGDGVDMGSTSDNAGGCLVGWATAGEWLEYDVTVPQSGLFDFTARLASATAGRALQLSVDGAAIGTVTSPNAGYNAFDDRKIQNVSLTAGPHVVRATFVQGDLNLNYIDISVHPVVPGYSFGGTLNYNAFAFQDLSLAPSAEGPVAAGRDIVSQNFSYNTLAAGTIGAVAGRNFNGTSGNIQRDLVYGTTLSLNNVSVLQGASRKATPLDFVAEKTTLALLSANLTKYPANGTTAVSPNGTTFSFTGADPSLNVFSVNGSALAAADQFNFSVPATSTTIVNVTGTAPVFETSSMQLGALTPGHLVWNFPQATSLRVSQTGFKGTLLAVNAAVTQTSSSLDGALIAGALTGTNSGVTWLPFDGSFTSCSGATLAITPGSPQLAGTPLALSATATCVDNLAPEFHFDYFNSAEAVWREVAFGFSTGAANWNTSALPAGAYQVRVVVRRAGETTLSGASAASSFVFDSPVSIPTSAPILQDFNGLGTAAVSTPAAGWRIDKQVNPRTLGTFTAATYKTDFAAGAQLAATASNGIYNFGAGAASGQATNYWLNSTDRALGWLSAGSDLISGGTKSGNLYFALRAPSNNSLTGLNVGYDVEKYNTGTNPSGFRVQLYSSTDGVTWTSAGANFLSSFAPDTTNLGFNPAPGKTVTVPTTTLNAIIPRNALFYLAWNYTINSPQAVDSSNAQALALDNVSVKGIACIANCAGKSCGGDLADGCGGFCPAVCGSGQAGCTKDEDCNSSSLQCASRSPDPNAHALCVPRTCTATCTAACPCSSAAPCTSASECGAGFACTQGTCACTPSCSGKACGAADGCGGQCADGCGPGDACQPGGCMPGLTCAPAGGGSTANVCRGPSVTFSDKPRPYQNLPSDAIVPSAPPGQPAPGRLAGSPQVDATGAFNYRIPIEVPLGRAGMQPHLALNYSSSNGNGLLGVGWNLEGISAIARCRKTVAREGIPDSIKVKASRCTGSSTCTEQFPSYNEIVDNFCLDGERLVRVGGTDTNPEFRTERDSFAKIVATYDGANWPSKFTVWRRDGTVSTYPAGTMSSGIDSRDLVTGQPPVNPVNGQVWPFVTFSGVLSWPLGISQDRFGNAVTYSYVAGEAGSASLIIRTIDYTTCAPGYPCPYGGATRRVQFNYEGRLDYIARWVGGLNAGLVERLTGINVFTLQGTEQVPVRSYKLAYDFSGATSRSRLLSLTECDAQGSCLNPTVFKWGQGKGQGFRRSWHVIGPDPAGTTVAGQCTGASPVPGCFYADFTTAVMDSSPDPSNPFIVGDFDGNGSDDILTLTGNLTQSEVGHDPDGYLELSHSENGVVTFERVHIQSGGVDSDRNLVRARAVDVDQDGQTEIIVPNDSYQAGEGHMEYEVQEYFVYRYNESVQDFVRLPLTVPTLSQHHPIGAPSMLDLNGDGVLDYFYDGANKELDGHGRAYLIARANPASTSLLPLGYTSALHLEYVPAPADQALYDQGRCGIQAIDYAGHGYSSPAVTCNDVDTATYFSDLNGDGLADILKINRGTSSFATVRFSTGVEVPGEHLSRGTRALLPEEQALPALTLGTTAFFSPLPVYFADRILHNRVVDMNGDGMADIVQFQTATLKEPPAIWLSKAESSTGSTIEKISLPYTQPRIGDVGQQVGDFNGDGLIDIVLPVKLETDGTFHHTKLQFLIQDSGNRDDLLTHVVTDSVDLATVTYKMAPTEQVGLGGGRVVATAGLFAPRRGLTVVGQTDLVEAGGRQSTSYYYTGPAADTHGRGFLGFGAILKANFVRGIKTSTFYDNTNYLHGNLHGYHIFPYAFVPSEIDIGIGKGPISDLPGEQSTFIAGVVVETRFEEQEFQHRVHTLSAANGSTTYFVEEFGSSDTKMDENRNPYFSSYVDRVYDDFGNVTFLSSSVGPESTDVETHFVNDPGANWLVAHPQWSKVTHSRDGNTGPKYSKPTVPQYVEYRRGASGEVKSVVSRPGDARTQTVTTYTRDAVGLIRTATSEDSFGNIRAHAYDFSADGAYPEHAQDALGHDTWVGFHPGLGVPVISYDQNQSVTRYQYDGFGHPRSEVPTRAPITTMSYAQTAGQLTTTVFQGPGTTTKKYQDGYGALFAEETLIGGSSSVMSYAYDSLGQLISKKMPRFGVPSAIPDYSYYYDNLGGLRFVQNPDGGTVTINVKSPLTTEVVTTSVDDKTKTVVVSRTQDGLVESVREKASAGPVLVRGIDYVYGANRSLFRATELGGPSTEYYSYGLPKPSYVVSRERGTDSLLYDGFFNLRSSTHNGPYYTSENYQYDALGRRTLSTAVAPDPLHPDQALSSETRFAYDVGPGAIGRLSSTVSPDGITTRYGYTPEGLFTHKEYESGTDRFSIDYQLDAYGRTYRIDYPQTGAQRFSVNLGYNDAAGLADGSLSSVSYDSIAYWSGAVRGPTGLAESVQLGAGLTQTITVDPATRAINRIVVAGSGAAVYDVRYSYYQGGNVKTRTDSLAGTDERFEYDAFDQLSKWILAGAAGAKTEDYAYDALGNQIDAGVKHKTFGGSGFASHQLAEQVEQSSIRRYTYDPLGRQTKWTTNLNEERTVTYTPFDLPRTVTRSQPTPHTVTYSYDAAQARFRQSDGTSTTTYVDDLYERRVDNATGSTKHVFYVYADGRRIAQVVRDGSTETVTRLHADALGSVTAANQGGARQSFSPWGERISLNPASPASSIPDVTAGFTDQEHDDGVGLVNMRGRVYDPTTATFLTPDPIVATPSKVTGWSKYGYVLNNPLKYTDPTGFYEDGQISDSDKVIWDPTCQACESSSTEEITQGYNDVPAGGSDDGGYIPMAVRNAPGGLAPEAYTITPSRHGPGTDDPFGLQPDFTVTPNYGVPSPPISAIDQLLAGGPSGGRKGMVLERPKPVPLVGDVYTAFGDKNATDDQKWAARLGILVNLGMMFVGPAGEARAAAEGAGGILARSEAAGGHLIERHVGLSAAALDARGIGVASTFLTHAEAEATATAAISGNLGEISAWLQAGAATNLKITTSFNGGLIRVAGGYEASATSAVFILKGDTAGGFYVFTGFPAP